MIVSTNPSSLAIHRFYQQTEKNIQHSLEKIASGKRINQASDDAAGLSISTRMTSQIRGSEKSIQNINDGISMLQTADGALSSIIDRVQRIRELALQAHNGTLNVADKISIQKEINQLTQSIDQTASSTTFNGISLLHSSHQFVFKNNYVTLPNESLNLSDSGTIEATFTSFGSTGSPQLIVDRYLSSVPSGYGYGLFIGAANKLNIRYGDTWINDLGPVLTDGKEHHAIFTKEENQPLTVYLDGKKIYQETIPLSTIPSQDTNTYIGARGSSNMYYFNGIIKDVRIYNSALSQTEALQNFKGDVTKSNLLGEWKLSEGSGKNVFDSSGNGNTGKIQGNENWQSLDQELSIHTGNSAEDTVKLTLPNGTTSFLGLNNLSVDQEDNLERIDSALEILLQQRSQLGTQQNMLNTRKEQITSFQQNMTISRSRVDDADIASELSALTKNKIISNMSLSLLAQSNSMPESFLQLLQ